MFVNGWTLLLVAIVIAMLLWFVYVISVLLRRDCKLRKYVKDWFGKESGHIQEYEADKAHFKAIILTHAGEIVEMKGLSIFFKYLESTDVLEPNRPKVWLAIANSGITDYFGIGTAKGVAKRWHGISDSGPRAHITIQDNYGHDYSVDRLEKDCLSRLLYIIANYESVADVMLSDTIKTVVSVCEALKPNIKSHTLAVLREYAQNMSDLRVSGKEYHSHKLKITEVID